MKETYQEAIIAMQFTTSTTQAILKLLDKQETQLAIKAKQAYEGEVPDFQICRYHPLTRLAILCYLLPEIKAHYRSFSIPEQIIMDTLSDITLRAQLYESKHHQPGVSKDDVIWFRHLIHAHIFKLGSLQFQLFHMIYLDEELIGEPYMSFAPQQKQNLPPDTPVINVHVQTGADLTPDKVDASFALALPFFKTYFPAHQPRAFLCYSWLLYPGNQRLLAKNSNILYFANKFQVLAQLNDTEDAIKRIYGKRYRKSADYPQTTSLQKAALHHFFCLGTACGIRIIP